MPTPKQVKWGRFHNGQCESKDGAFLILKGDLSYTLWYGANRGIMAGKWPKLQEAKDHAQKMRDCGNA